MNIISVIQDPAVIDKILGHLHYKFQVLPLSARPPPSAQSPCRSIATAGDFLNWNPHIHALVASAVFRPDNSFVPVPLFQENVLRELFEANVYKLLASEGLITAELIAKMRTWRHSGFHVYAGGAITQKEDALRVGCYIVRAPASASRLAVAEDGLLKYLARGTLANDRCDPLFEPNGQILDPLDWIARVTLHIPERENAGRGEIFEK